MRPQDFLERLREELPTSAGETRQKWAKEIVDNNYDLPVLSKCLLMDYPIATRFSWLLSDVGMVDSAYLFAYLPELYTLRDQIDTFDFSESLIKYWRICGVPEQNEGEALDLLFEKLSLSDTKMSIRHVAVEVLIELHKKYPEIENELRIALENQLNFASETLKVKLSKLLVKLSAG